MEILEEFIASKTNDIEDCEDGIFKSNNFIAVIDGATAKTNVKYDELSPGKKGKDVVLECLLDFKADISCREAINSLTNKIAEYYRDNGIFERLLAHPEERMSLSIVIFSKFRKEIWMIGDCQCIVDYQVYTNKKKVDTVMAELRSFYNQWELMSGASIQSLIEKDLGREFILPLLKKQYLFQNNMLGNDFSYGVIDGFNLDDDKVKIVSNFQSNIIVLASDGYPQLFNSLSKSENYLNEVLNLDPLCIKKYKSTKGKTSGNYSFDDRAFIKFLY
jgi:glycerophosphoryl diester phosphodiesterase